jgi:hypothetical protein
MSDEIASTESPVLYTQEYDGEFVPQKDIIYPPGTTFYIEHPDGTFEPQDTASIEPASADETQQVTREFMIDTACGFLREQGYRVTAPEDMCAVVGETEAAQGGNIEVHLLLDQLRGMVISHVSNRGSIDDMCNLIEKIKESL